jgi:hypothetical protein
MQLVYVVKGEKYKFSELNVIQENSANTETKVVNVRVKYIRPLYENLRDWCECPDNIYIGRKGIVFIDTLERYPPKDSIWANPYKKSDAKNMVMNIFNGKIYPHNTNTIELYEKYITRRVCRGDITTQDLLNLKGKNLGCWCKEPNKEIPCHGDILLKLIEKYS